MGFMHLLSLHTPGFSSHHSYSSRVHACVLREIRAGGCLEAGMTSVTRMIAKSFESHLLSSVHEIIL